MKKISWLIVVALVALVALNFIVGNVPKPGQNEEKKQPTNVEFEDPTIVF